MPEILDQCITPYFLFHSYRKSGLLQKFWTSVFFIPTENLVWSRNSGLVYFSFIQKIWGGPEILDQLYFIHLENLEWSKNSGLVAFHSCRKSVPLQKFWTSCISFIQKIWSGPEILDQVYLVVSFIDKFWRGSEILDQL